MNYNFEYTNKKFLALIFAVIGVCIIIPFTGIFPVVAENFAYSAVQVAPFMLLALTAYMSEKYPGLRIFTTIWLFTIIIMIATASFGIAVLSVLPPGFLDESLQEGGDALVFGDETGISTAISIFQLFVAVIFASIISLAGQIRAFRAFLSRHIPINPDSFIHKTALTAVIAMTLIPIVPLFVTGMPPYLSPLFLESAGDTGIIGEVVSMDIFSLFWMILASLVIAGLYICRSFPDVLERLGLVKLSKKELVCATGFGVMLVGAFFFIEHAISALWEFFGWTITNEESVNLLFAAYLTPVAAAIAAISAGFGEEIAVRGLLQPRFGIIIPSLLFASLHAFQYNWDGVLSVFIAGIIFALIRKYYNTTFSAVTHTTYDLILFYAIMLGISI